MSTADTAPIYRFEVQTITGQPTTLEAYRGKVLLIVNVASQCGLTPQYKGLQELYEKYHSQGLEILGFPCNQFGGQEPGTEKEVAQFCETHYAVTFPLFSKIEVNGSGTHPLYQYLKKSQKGLLGTEAIKWNFTKFLIARDGTPLDRIAPQTEPKDIAPAIEKALATQG